MNTSKINRNETGLFSTLPNQLVYQQEKFTDFINQPFGKEAFGKQIQQKKKQFPVEHRAVLVEVLKKQYAAITTTDKVSKNIDLLGKDTTFTLTTGHQLSLFTGPLYFIYKIVHVIKQCEELKQAYPENDFVPIYWMGSEDHDFEEINHFQLFGKKYTWESEQKGPTGRFDTTGLEEIRATLHQFFENHPESEIHEIIDTYDGDNFAEAQFKFVNRLFENYGLVVIEPDNVAFKKLFIPIIEKELTQRQAEKEVQETTELLEKMGYSGQVFPRPINFFYIEKGFRERIKWENNAFVIDGKGVFSQEEILKMLHDHPEAFSPNVIFRPIYQEVILPNLSYVGGGGEMAYWLQLKKVFDSMNVLYPLIQVRNSLQIIDKGTAGKLEKLQLNLSDFFKDVEELKKEYVAEHSEDAINFDTLTEQFNNFKAELIAQIGSLDAQMHKMIEVENTKLDKQFDFIQQRVIRAQKQKMEGAMKQIEDVKNKMFPSNSLQERVDLFLNYCPNGNVSEFIEMIYNATQPFEGDFIVVHSNL